MSDELNNDVVVETPPVAPTPEAAPEPAPAPEKTQADPKDRGAMIRQAMIEKGIIKPADKPRDEKTGQFVQPPKGKPIAKPAEKPADDEVPFPTKSMKKELEQYWKQAHPELRKAFVKRDEEYERGINGYRTKAQEADAVLSEFKPYENIMRASGSTPQTALRSLLPTMAVLTTGSPAEKAMVLARAMQQYGIPLEHIQQVMQGGAPQGDPYIQQLQQQVSQLTQAFQSTQQRTEEAENARMMAVAESFGSGKPHFDELRPQMWSLLQAQSAAEQQGVAGPFGDSVSTRGWTEQQWVEHAYNAAIRLNPALYESELNRQREEAARAEREKATEAARASRAAAVQVRGAPAPAATAGQTDPRDRRAVIAAAMRARAT